MMKILPLQTLLKTSTGPALPLPVRLAALYGEFRLRKPRNGLHVFSNFVSTLDGIVSLHARGHSGGGDISGFSAQDRFVMGLLRSVADAVVVGAGALAADPQHIWTAQAICPELAVDFEHLAARLGKRGPPVNVIVSASGTVNLRLPVFNQGMLPVWILTTRSGAKRLLKQRVPSSVQIRVLPARVRAIPAPDMLRELEEADVGKHILLEGGPQLMGAFYGSRCLDEQFLSLAPQIAGRKDGDGRPNLVMGRTFGPADPLWGKLSDARLGTRLLFMRYEFPRDR